MDAGAASSSFEPPPPPAAAASRLAPGFRFHPTDEELVIYYLKRKVRGRPLRLDAIAEVDLYKCEPWDLPGRSRIRSRDLEWYFFSPLDRKHSSRSRTSRATPQGYWKTTGKDRPVRSGPRVVGTKKTLVFHAGRAPRGTRSNWVMHEYRLEDEQSTQVGISQDAYVVCRVFQKSAAGPQNGAQYGAPFLEEEWEEEAPDGVVLMPDGGEDEFKEAAELEFLQYDGFVKNEDLEDQHVNASNFVADLDRKDSGSLPEDSTILLDELLDGPCYTNMVESIDEPGQQIGPTLVDGMENKTFLEGCSYSQSCPNQKDEDEYMENDLADTVNVEYLSSEESVGYPIRNRHTQNMDGEDGNSNLQKMFDVEEFFDTMSQNPDQPDTLRISPVLENSYIPPNDLDSVAGGCPFSVFCDAPTDDLAFGQNELLYSSADDPSGFEMVDDLLVYFDATDNVLHEVISRSSECISSSDQSNSTREVDGGNCPTGKATAQVPDTNTVDGASSSVSSIAHNQSKCKYEKVSVTPDVQRTDADGKTVAKHLVNMLGSISAPPAFAAESPPESGKSMAQISAAASSVHVAAGFVRIYGLTSSEIAGHLYLQKNGHAVILSYSVADIVARKSAAPGPITKSQVDAASTVVLGGLYLFLLSALILTVSCKVGRSIYAW